MNKQISPPVIETKDQLTASLEAGNKPHADWLIGTEHEKFVFTIDDLKSVPFKGENGIAALLDFCLKETGGQPIIENDHLIGVKIKDAEGRGASLTLEPGGQFELSGAPLKTLHETNQELISHFNLIEKAGKALGLEFLFLGFHPLALLQDVPRMPKERYDIMRAYMPKVGSHGLDMMHRTCTVQVNLDFSSEQDMVKKFRAGLALQPLATALFANSCLVEGKLTDYQSYRSYCWLDVDQARTGMLPFVFDEGMSFERYVDYALDVPMYFITRKDDPRGPYIDCSGQSFRAFLDGKMDALPGQKPTMQDWEDHLTTIFPEVRLKTFLEMRGADCGPQPYLTALPAFWTGLLYDDQALDQVVQLMNPIGIEELIRVRREVPLKGLHGKMAGKDLFVWAEDILELAIEGLARRGAMNKNGRDETIYLNCLEDICAKRQSLSDQIKQNFQNEPAGNIKTFLPEFFMSS